MTKALNDIVVILYPMPKPTEFGTNDIEAYQEEMQLYDEACEAVREQRETYFENLDAAADALDTDPLLLAIGEITAQEKAARSNKARVIAYAREIAPGRKYSLEALGEAANMSTSGIRTAYTAADVQAVRIALETTQASPSPTLTYSEMHRQVNTAIGMPPDTHAYDTHAITRELIDAYGLVTVSDVSREVFWEIARRHDGNAEYIDYDDYE